MAEAQANNVEAVVKQRESQLAQAKVDLDRTTIRAPVDGIVMKKRGAGQTVAASLQAPELFVIAQNLRDMQVETSIDEVGGRPRSKRPAGDVHRRFVSRPHLQRHGRQVRKAALVVQNVVTYTAVISAANPDLQLFPGMTANVRISIDKRDNVLKLPNAALRFRPAGVGGVARPGAAATARRAAAADGRRAAGAEQLRERLVKELKLDAEQQAKLEPILADLRQDSARCREDEADAPSGRARARRDARRDHGDPQAGTEAEI